MASKRRLFKIQSQNSFDDCLVLGNHRRPAQPHSLPCKYYIVILTSYQIQFQMCTVLLALKLVIWFYSDKFTKRRVYTVLLAWPLFLITSSKLEAGARAFGLSKSKSRFLWSCLQEHQGEPQQSIAHNMVFTVLYFGDVRKNASRLCQDHTWAKASFQLQNQNPLLKLTFKTLK